jgi:hypothetical protein
MLRPYTTFAKNSSNKKGQKMRAGEYYPQLWVQTWYYYADVKIYRERWGDRGYVWSEVLRPNPIVFVVKG